MADLPPGFAPSQPTSPDRPPTVTPRGREASLPSGFEPSRPPALPESGTTFRRGSYAVGQGFYKSMAAGLGLPADAMTGAINFFGSGFPAYPGASSMRLYPKVENPYLGSENIRSGMESMGMIGMDIQPGIEETFERVGYEIGSSTMALTGAGVAARTRVAGNALTRPFIDAMRYSPGVTTTGELAGAAGAAVAGSMMAEAVPPDHPMYGTAQIAAELVGGGVPDFLVSGAAGLYRRSRAIADPFTPAGERRAVGAELREEAVDPARAVENLEMARPLETVGQASNDPGLVSAERALSASNEGVFRARETEQNQALRAWFDTLKPQAGPQATQDYLGSRVERIRNQLDFHVDAAKEYADQVISAANFSPGSLEANEVTRRALRDALQFERLQEKQIWSAIDPDGLELDANELQGYLTRYLDGLVEADRDLVPQDVVRIVERLATPELDDAAKAARAVAEADATAMGIELPPEPVLQPVQEYLGLRRVISERIREADAAKRFSESRILRGLRDGVVGAGEETTGFLDNLDFVESEDFVTRYQEARDFTKQLHDKFTRGDVGRILGLTREGGDIVPEALTIEAIFRAGERGHVSTDQALNALGSRVEAVDMIERQGMSNFVDYATNPLTGRVDPRKLADWRDRFGPALRNLPRLEDSTSNVFKAQQAIDTANSLQRRTTARLQRTQAANFIGADPQTAVRSALTGRTPVGNMQSLVRSAKRDTTGAALLGLQRGFLDMIPAELRRLDIHGDPFLNPGAIRNFMNKNVSVLTDSGLFTQSELDNMLTFTEALERSQRVLLATPRAGSDTAPKALGLNQILSRLYGLERGVVGPRFVASEVGARILNRFLQKTRQTHLNALLTEAYLNPDLARTLMMEATPQNAERTVQRLRTYLLNNGYATEEELADGD